MNKTAHYPDQIGDTGKIIARMEAEDATWIIPLREYFERYGCQVVVNRNTTETVSYVIAIGSSSFVKRFFDYGKWQHAKKLAVIYEDDGVALEGKNFENVKQYHLDPSPLTEKTARDICSFFFTGNAFIKNIRKEQPRSKILSGMPKEALREDAISTSKQVNVDAQRINSEINKLYALGSKSGRTMPAFSRFVLSGMLALVALFVPFIFYILSVVTSVGLLFLSTKTLEKGNETLTRTFITYSSTYRSFAQSLLNTSSPLFLLFRQQAIIEDQDRLLSILNQVAAAESGVMTIFQKSNEVVGGVFNPHGTTRPIGVSDVIELKIEVSRVHAYLGLAVSQLETLITQRRYPFKKPSVARFTTQVLTKLASVRTTVGYTEKLLTLYPSIAGFRQKQTYLVLLQNSMELRPTGGFIGSLLLITFLDGKVDSMEVQDVYTADGQLKGHVDPPRPIREILGNEHWYLRDSNWDPDFSLSGEKAKWFYEKEMNLPIDGVIALSLPFVTRLLSVTGPIELLDFNERISESNFFAKSLLYTEVGFFPGSTKKKDFLGALAQALLTRITTDRNLPAGLLLSAFERGVEARDIQFYFSDMEIERLLTQWEWHGGINIEECQSIFANVRCVGDGAAVVEANLGVNKVNFFVTREAVEEIVIHDSGDVDHELTIHFQNAASVSQGSDWSYMNYLRVFIPKDAVFDRVLLDGSEVPKREDENAPPPAPYWLREDTLSGTSIHIVFKIPPSTSSQLTFRWSRNKLLPHTARIAYQNTIRKQPGVSSTPWRTVIEFPQSWGVIREGGIAKPGAFEYTTDLVKDESVRVLFQRNL